MNGREYLGFMNEKLSAMPDYEALEWDDLTEEQKHNWEMQALQFGVTLSLELFEGEDQ